MNTRIYDKTDKGREEIATRKYQLRSKLRTLLVMIDGRHSLGALLKDFSVLGMSGQHIDELLEQGYIALIEGEAELPAPDAVTGPRPPASARARMQARIRSQAAREPGASVGAGAGADIAPPSARSDGGTPDTHGFGAPDKAAARRGLFDYFNLANDSVNY